MKHYSRYDLHKELKLIWLQWLALLFACLALLTSCSTTKKTHEQKAYEARQQELAQGKIYRELYPCDTSTVYITKTDTAFITLAPDTITVDGIKYITKDRVITNTITKQVTVIDSAALHELRLDGMQKDYLLQNCQEGANKIAAEIKDKDKQIEKLKPWKYWIIVGISCIGFAGALFGFFKLKSFFL